MRKDKVLVNVDRLLIILGCFGEFAEDEVKLCAVVVNVGILLVLLNGLLEISGGSILVTCDRSIISSVNRVLSHTLLQVHACSLNVA